MQVFKEMKMKISEFQLEILKELSNGGTLKAVQPEGIDEKYYSSILVCISYDSPLLVKRNNKSFHKTNWVTVPRPTFLSLVRKGLIEIKKWRGMYERDPFYFWSLTEFGSSFVQHGKGEKHENVPL